MRTTRIAAAAGLAVVGFGCAGHQVVSLTLEPAPVELYVDGKLADPGAQKELRLRKDRAHVLLVKRAGYRTAQVVIDSVDRGHGRELEPDAVILRLEPLTAQGRRVEVGVDDDEAAPGPAPSPPGD